MRVADRFFFTRFKEMTMGSRFTEMITGKERAASSGRTLLVGCGYMGKRYLQLLVGKEIRCDEETITVVDRNPEKLAWCSAHYPRVRVTENLDVALAERPSVVLNITNTPEHFGVLRRALDRGIRTHFVEKPLVLPEHLEALTALGGNMTVGVGYLMNFSGALTRLFEFMRKHKLVAREIRASWGEDRIGDSRSSAGDLEDEATYLLCTALSVIEFNQEISEICVQAVPSSVPFVDGEAQRRAHREDVFSPETRTAMSHVALDIATNRFRYLLVTSQSSFNAFAPERRIDVNLADRYGALEYVARLTFDARGKDRLSVRAERKKDSSETWLFPSHVKLVAQLRAFLVYAACGEKNPQLATYELGERMVRISRAARESDTLGCKIMA
jgi:predicted dehydrogenase